jgi:hypothetical protein
MKALALTVVAAISLFAAGTSSAQAQWYGSYGGYGGWNQPYYGHYHHNVNPYTATWGGGHLHWHDTSHYHYQPPTVVPHRNHYHYQPGGYYLHQQGHWDLHH